MDKRDQTSKAIGKIIANLLSIEFVLRLFLYESVGPKHAQMNLWDLKVGDKVPENPITNYHPLGKLIDKVNQELERRGVPDRVDTRLVDLRDALAHGRVLANQPEGPFRLFKFSQPDSAKLVEVEFAVDLSQDWLDEQIKQTDTVLFNLVKLGRDLDLGAFPP